MPQDPTHPVTSESTCSMWAWLVPVLGEMMVALVLLEALIRLEALVLLEALVRLEALVLLEVSISGLW